MRFCWAVGAVLLSGLGVLAVKDDVVTSSIEATNNRFTLSIQPTDNIVKCYLLTPSGENLELIPEDKSGDRYELQGPTSSACLVTVSDANEKDKGLWEIHAETANGGEVMKKYSVTVPKESETDNLKISDDDENIKWLTEINYITRIGLEVSITLSKTNHEEDCFLRTPEDESYKVEDLRRTGVTDHYGSEFVSCRVVIGPMTEDESLLGNWALCGRYIEDSVEHVRCQPAKISWSNPNRPEQVWDTRSESIDYVVNYGKTLTPALSEPRDIITCHIITPYGEDLVVNLDSEYPGLTRVPSTTSICSVAIGPIHAGLLGDWTIYGIYTSFFGTAEQRRAMHLYLYDNDDPYNQAYNITNLDPINRIVNMHSTIEMQVLDSSDTNDCYSRDPSGVVYTTTNITSSGKVSFITERGICRIILGPITDDMLGNWLFTGKFVNSRGNFIERRQPVRLIKEDPANPAEDIPRRIENLTPQRFETKFNASHSITIRGGGTSFVTYESCHIITPYKLQYIIMEGFNVPGVEVIEDSELACGVIIHVDADKNIGEWMLMSREIVLSSPTEKRLPFTIYVEEDVPASPSNVDIGEGNDFYVRLRNPTEIHDTCKLVPPQGNGDAVYELDDRIPEYCGFIVRDIKKTDGGEWRIVYGHGATYIATTQVNVIGRFEATNSNVEWIRDRPVNQTHGPEDTVYCRIQDPTGFIFSEGFGRCTIALDRARSEHAGVWKLTIGRVGHITTEEQMITVRVNEPQPKAVVTTNVEKEDHQVLISCAVATSETVRNCKFRNPHGKLLLATEGVGQDGYEYHGFEVSMETNVEGHQCGLRITNPTNDDLGIWRCALETDRETYFGFMLVICPIAMEMVPELADIVVTEPVLEATTRAVSIIEGETAIMSCSVPAPIRYCYFRARNGTVYSVSPDATPLPQQGTLMRSYHQNPPPTPSPGRPMPYMEYVGAGFDAGECGMRIPTLRFADTGSWTCHVGFTQASEPEQSAIISINVEEEMAATQTMVGNLLEVQAVVHGGRQLEYCRFVRMDGLGFTSENMLPRYISGTTLSRGLCRISMWDPTILEMHPWTVVARVMGQDFEIARQTPASFPAAPPTTPTPPPVHEPRPVASASFVWLWIMITMLLVTVFFFGILLGPRRNRQWTATRARNIRNSFRKSIEKKPLPDNQVNTHDCTQVSTNTHVNTAVSA